MSILCQPMANQTSIHPMVYESWANPAPIQHQSIANPSPIRCQFIKSCANLMSIQCQSDANLVKIHRYCKVNQLPIHLQSVPIRCKSSQSVSNPPPVRCRGPILCQSNSNLTSIQCQFCQSIVNSTSIHPNPVPIQCQSNANLMPILCQADAIASPYDANPVPIHPNLMSIQCQSSANRVQIKCSLI